jgi:hypothetical protein
MITLGKDLNKSLCVCVCVCVCVFIYLFIVWYWGLNPGPLYMIGEAQYIF